MVMKQQRQPPHRGSVASAATLPPLPDLDLPDGVSCWTGEELDEARRRTRAATTSSAAVAHGGDDEARDAARVRALCQTIDGLGVRSQHAQGVPAVLTSVARLRESTTYRLYLLVAARRGVGVLKMGTKKLFVVHPQTRSLVEVDPLCVLDFYIDETCQRRGYGRRLFDHMLQCEAYAAHPERLAIDRPSDKFVAFLAKHYGLVACSEQRNHFVVYDRFFDRTTVTERGQLRRLPSDTRGGSDDDSNSNNRENVASSRTTGHPAAGCMAPTATPPPLLSGAMASGEERLRPRMSALVNTPVACVARLAPPSAAGARGRNNATTTTTANVGNVLRQHELCAQREQQLEQRGGGNVMVHAAHGQR